MNYKCYAMVFVAMLLAACEMGSSAGASAPDVQPRSSASAPAVEVAASTDDIESRLSKNMAYADLRVAAVEDGWQPVIDLECKANVVGGNHEQLCSANPDLDSCQICDRLPELGSCSGDGYCGMTFTKNGRTFGITTYGMIEDWNVRGDQSRLNVSGWEISK